MATIAESLGTQSQLNATLEAGENTLSTNQAVTFTQYVRKVLPTDGWIFWLNTGQSITVEGSLHYATHLHQREDETIGISRVTFTAESPVQDFSAVAPDTIYIATLGEIRFAFSDQANFYQQAGLYHYSGDAVYPAMESQIVDTLADLNLTDQVISNSLPVWLALSGAAVFGLTPPAFPIYPSFLVPQNAAPPYASIHIGESDTEAVQGAPWFDFEQTHWQLVKDRVKVVLYGVRNADALDFQDFVFQYSINSGIIGIMNVPVIRDEKRTQTELGILAQKKRIEFEVNYYQSALKALAWQYILSAVPTFIVNNL
jgi:hypothetical protein